MGCDTIGKMMISLYHILYDATSMLLTSLNFQMILTDTVQHHLADCAALAQTNKQHILHKWNWESISWK